MPTDLITVSNLKPLRAVVDYPRPALAAVTRIPLERLRDIELRKCEPWLDEALLCARALNRTIFDLLSPEDVKAVDLDPRFYDRDLEYWRAGVRLPLSMALRLAHRFGCLPDDLDPSPLTRQIWAIVESGERTANPYGLCPWCLAETFLDEPHRPHCLPHNLYAARTARGGVTETDAPRPMRKGGKEGSARAYGLRALRCEAGMTQAELAKALGVAPNHYARIERGELPLVVSKADMVCELLKVKRSRLFTG